MKRLYVTAAITATLLVGYVAGFKANEHTAYMMDAGTTFFSVADDDVTFLAFTSKAWNFTAQRSHASDKFLVQTTFADSRASQQCTLRADLDGILASFTELVVKRPLSHPEQSMAEFPVVLGFLDIRNANLEPQAPFLIATNRAGTALAVKAYGYAAEITLPVAVLKKLETGCAIR